MRVGEGGWSESDTVERLTKILGFKRMFIKGKKDFPKLVELRIACQFDNVK